MTRLNSALKLDETIKITTNKKHLFSDLKDKGVILSLDNGKYYGINEVGKFIWQLLQSPLTSQEIQAAVLSNYKVDNETCRSTVNEFIQNMMTENLIFTVDE